MAQIQKELEAPSGPPGRENALLLEKQQLRVEMEGL
jgi:hypothetical protein